MPFNSKVIQQQTRDAGNALITKIRQIMGSMNRQRLVMGIGIAFLLIVSIAGLIRLSTEWQGRQTQVSWRQPVSGLAYCDSNQVTPCIISFSLDRKGEMLVNILADDPLFPAFYLKVKHDDGESIYPCQEVQGFSTSVYCIGKALPVGNVFQFFILALDDNRLLAQGNFSIIGMALSTVEVFSSANAGTPSTPLSVSTTGSLPPQTPTPTGVTRTPTVTRTPSYPNPGTGTPGYPNPKP